MLSCNKKADSLKSAYPLVRARGLEPPHIAALDPKSSVSTNSTTPAFKSFTTLRTRCNSLLNYLSGC